MRFTPRSRTWLVMSALTPSAMLIRSTIAREATVMPRMLRTARCQFSYKLRDA